MIYGYPYYLGNTYQGGDITDSFDSEGTGSRYFYFDAAEETDYYVKGVLTHTAALVDYHSIETAYYDPQGQMISYDHIDFSADFHDGWAFTPKDLRYDKYTYSYSTYYPYLYENFEYTSKSGAFHYSLLRTGMEWSDNISEQYTDPRNGAHLSYSFHAYDHGLSAFPDYDQQPIYREKLVNGNTYVEQILGYNSERSLLYSPTNQLLGETRFNSDGVVWDTQYLANGDRVTVTFAGTLGTKYIASEVTRHADSSVTENYYDLLGHLTKETDRDASGAFEVKLFSNGVQTAENVYLAGGTLAVTDRFLAGGSHEIIAHVSGQTLEGGAKNDTLTDFGATVFQFRGAFGHDTVRGFDATPGPDHDVISLIGTAAHGYDDLIFAGSSAGVMVTVDDHSSVMLLGVKLAQVSADDFLFA